MMNHELHENRWSENHILLKAFPHLSDLALVWHKRRVHNAVENLLVS